MIWKQLFARKTLETLHAEAAGENRLRRILGPVSLTSLGIGAIIGAGIFVMTGRVAAEDAGPAVMLSYVVAGVGCVFAAFCYAEFASMAPVAGSAYTYAYATLGEVFAWIIGWDLVLEYAMACAVVAAGWTEYLNEFLKVLFHVKIPMQIASDPFSISGAWFNLPAVFIILACTVVLVIGIRESATTNAILVAVKVGVVLFVIVVGSFYIDSRNWTGIPPSDRLSPEQELIPKLAKGITEGGAVLTDKEFEAEKKRIEARARELILKGPRTPQAADKMAQEIGADFQTLHWLTAKLPEKEDQFRVSKITCEALVVYQVDRKRQEVAGVEKTNPAEARKEVIDTLTGTALRYVRSDIPLGDEKTEQREKAGEATRVLYEVVAQQLHKEKGLSEGQKREVLARTVRDYTTTLNKRDILSNSEAAALLEEAQTFFITGGPPSPLEQLIVNRILTETEKKVPGEVTKKWGLIGEMGVNKSLEQIDASVRSPFAPYGLSGIIFGASLVFFAYIGFDAISTHSEEAVRPQRDVPIGILASLLICTVLYILVSAVITGMEPYPNIDPKAAVAAAFSHRAEVEGNSVLLNMASLLISIGALAGLTSVLLITFLSQARIFLAMARDGLMPPRIFGAIHERFRTPHLSTMLTGGVIAVVAALTPIQDLEQMVNIGTLMAFVIVCAAVLLLRIRHPHAHRPFRTPFLFVMAPLGIVVNLLMMLFLPIATWLRLVVWLALGLIIYFSYGVKHSTVGKQLEYKQTSQEPENG